MLNEMLVLVLNSALVVQVQGDRAAMCEVARIQKSELLGAVLFREGSAELGVVERDSIKALVNVPNEQGDRKFLIVGHADEVGPESHNDRLAEQRAAAAKRQVQSLAPGSVVDYMTCGERIPVLPSSGAGHPHNRRVEVRLEK